MGISLKPGNAEVFVQALAARASAGDKQAQLDLGIAFEEGGAGLERDEAKALTLYRRANRGVSNSLWLYVPSPGGGAPSRVIQVQSGRQQIGLVEAHTRLRSLEAKRKKRHER